jgi:AcrR family transcriptional regulator
MPGLRERNKQQKLERIKQAAWTLFRQKGFEETTTREIAEQAEVGTGTVFLYAKDKHELLLLVYGDLLGNRVQEIFANFPAGLSLPDELLHIFGRLFALYAEEIPLARIFVKELYHGTPEDQMAVMTQGFIGHLAQRVVNAQQRGEIADDLESVQAAGNFFALYFFALTVWLGGWLDAETRDTALRQAIELQIRGMLPSTTR